MAVEVTTSSPPVLFQLCASSSSRWPRRALAKNRSQGFSRGRFGDEVEVHYHYHLPSRHQWRELRETSLLVLGFHGASRRTCAIEGQCSDRTSAVLLGFVRPIGDGASWPATELRGLKRAHPLYSCVLCIIRIPRRAE